MRRKTIHIDSSGYRMKLIVLGPRERKDLVPGILWIHGGGYVTGMAAMVYGSCGLSLAKEYGTTVISPEYRLAGNVPYPAALDDCYKALEYMWDNAEELGIDRNRIMVGGESAGGGLAAATCLYARDKAKVKVAMQMLLYPMLDCEDTESSADNHGRIWNTKRNHWGWRHYLGDLYGTEHVPPYASPSRESDFAGLPPCYSYVCDGEPFYCETLEYIDNLRSAGVPAKVDVFPGNVHAFDIFCFWSSYAKEARKNRAEAFRDLMLKS